MFGLFAKKPLLPAADQQSVTEAIAAAEARTTGEIRVYVESRCEYMEAMDRAREVFGQLQMERTEARNAVLVYLALDDRQFAIMGDEQIYVKAGGPAFWQQAALRMQDQLRQGRICPGICAAVEALGDALAAHFPADPSARKNELPDEIVFGS